jgi:hypothetical protein
MLSVVEKALDQDEYNRIDNKYKGQLERTQFDVSIHAIQEGRFLVFWHARLWWNLS